MSWHCSQALVAEFSGECYSGGGRSAPSKSNHTAGAFSCSDRMTDVFRRSLSGTMYERSTGTRGADSSMSSAEDSPVKMLRSVVAPRTGSKANALGFGWKWPESYARWDRDSCSWRTRQCSLLEGLDEFSATWRRWGLMRGGECSALAPLVPHIHGNGCSLLPTPLASQGKRGWGLSRSGRRRHGPAVTENVFADIDAHGWRLEPTAHEWLMGWPIGWTDSRPLAMDRFQLWLRVHGSC